MTHIYDEDDTGMRVAVRMTCVSKRRETTYLRVLLSWNLLSIEEAIDHTPDVGVVWHLNWSLT